MSKPVPLLNDKHAKLKVIQSTDYTRYKDSHLIPIIASDFFTLAAEFPLVFVKDSKAGEFVAVAIMGLREGQNLYCQTERWKAQVTPISFANAPLAIARVDSNDDQYAVLVDEDSPLLSQSEGEALFTESGEKTPFLERKIDAMLNVKQQAENTRKVCKILAEKGLLVEQKLQLQLPGSSDAPSYNINGIYTVSEEALNGLSDEDFLQLRRKGLLPLIFSHLTSLQQLRRISAMQYEADKLAAAESK